MHGEEYVRWAAAARQQIADLCTAVTAGRITEAEGVAAVQALHREAHGLYAAAEAEHLVLTAQSRIQAARIAELEELVRTADEM